jgi:hypothetical protein
MRYQTHCVQRKYPPQRSRIVAYFFVFSDRAPVNPLHESPFTDSARIPAEFIDSMSAFLRDRD